MSNKIHDKPRATKSEEREHIVPLGLTTREAKAWYRHDVIMPWIVKELLMIASATRLVFSTLTPLGEFGKAKCSIQHGLADRNSSAIEFRIEIWRTRQVWRIASATTSA